VGCNCGKKRQEFKEAIAQVKIQSVTNPIVPQPQNTNPVPNPIDVKTASEIKIARILRRNERIRRRIERQKRLEGAAAKVQAQTPKI
jgi:hypothetical protein